MPIQVELRITGIYFGSPLSKVGPIQVSVPEAPTVKQVLDAAIVLVKEKKVKGTDLFAYSPPQPKPGEMLQSVSVYYSEPPLKPASMPTAVQPGAGLYVLTQRLDSPYEQVLQYYHYRPTTVNGKPALTQLNINSKFSSFTQPPEEPIIAGDMIVWRLVTIENAPVQSSRAYGAAMRSADFAEGALI